MNWIADRFDDVRRKGARDKGFVLISTIMLFVMVAGTVYAMISTANRTVTSAVQSSDFIQSGQLADLAIQDAMYQLNEVRPAVLPGSGTPRTGGNADTGTWQWYADPVEAGAGGPSAVIHATGDFRAAQRKVQATAQAPRVGGFKANADKSITYQVAPSTAFTHTVMGESVTVRNGIGSGNPFITGSIGLTGGMIDVKAAAGTISKADVQYFQYGPAATAQTLAGAVRAPAGMTLDSGFISDNMGACGGATPQAWKASHYGGVLTANGNSGCFSSMDFDVPTVIEGNGSFNAYVSGGVDIRDNISAASGTGLNIYTNGNVAFPTEEAGGTALTVKNVFVYAPQGICSTVAPSAADGFRSTLKALEFTGSLACKTVKVAGQFTNADPIDPEGDEVFDNTVWYLADYQQPSGARTR